MLAAGEGRKELCWKVGLGRLNDSINNELKSRGETKENSLVDYWSSTTRRWETTRREFEITCGEATPEEQMEDLGKRAASTSQEESRGTEPRCLLGPDSPVFAQPPDADLDPVNMAPFPAARTSEPITAGLSRDLEAAGRPFFSGSGSSSLSLSLGARPPVQG